MSLSDVLNALAKVEGVDAVLVVSRDGLVLDHVSRSNIDISSIGAIASSSLGATEVLGDTMGQGVLKQQIAEYQNGKALIQQVNNKLLLVMIGNTKANLGMMRYAIDSTFQALTKNV